MKKIIDRINSKAKGEQLFLLTIILIVSISLFCVTGCGSNKSCETPKCGSKEYDNGSANGCSIPGCGGCLTPESGCDAALWAQSCKCVRVSSKKSTNENEETPVAGDIAACDSKYYGDGCLGCGQQEKSLYCGYINFEDDSDNFKGVFYGSDAMDESFIGYSNGCVRCSETNDVGQRIMNSAEEETGVK